MVKESRAVPPQEIVVPSLLVVEDEPNDIALILRGMEKAGVLTHVQVVRDGAAALDYLLGKEQYFDRSRHPLPALMTLDLKLPKKSGLEVLEWIRKDDRFGNLPIIILTSSRETRDVARATKLGVLSYHVKPMDLRETTELVKSIAEQWKTLVKSTRLAAPESQGDRPAAGAIPGADGRASSAGESSARRT